ncbi:hypothetical protein QQF64_015026 [Cirrhinus molitorella]|uniref:Uncharacterized protein n=1 Tax=Cirrhinus molitorella TaxID=172907 RepID=A0ABR3NUI6_9TELE
MCMNTSRHLTHVNLQFGSLLAPQWAATRPMSEVRKVLGKRGFRKEACAFYRKDHLNFGIFSEAVERIDMLTGKREICGAEMGQLREAQENDIRHKLRK